MRRSNENSIFIFFIHYIIRFQTSLQPFDCIIFPLTFPSLVPLRYHFNIKTNINFFTSSATTTNKTYRTCQKIDERPTGTNTIIEWEDGLKLMVISLLILPLPCSRPRYLGVTCSPRDPRFAGSKPG